MGSTGEEGQKGPKLPENLTGQSERAIAEEDMQRAHVYGLLARLLSEPMSDETLEIVRALEGHGDDTEFGQAISSLGAIAVRTARTVSEEEYTKLFYGMGAGGELHPYTSHYLTGYVYEKPLAELRKDMTVLGIAPSGSSSEPEDHIAYVCEIMHGLITGTLAGGADLTAQKKFFESHLAPWAGQFFTDLEGAESAALYMPVGTIGRLFMAIEADAFEMAA
ncbi:MAG: molecular chaperone TorD [Rhodospirillaceae bacterium]|jgi:TorA maturation chaperone TorD|nr:molecular chaperone TorD [Rhodospirillaceae bacterium]|tara:strand:- start:8777 stop:9439 length:663 start_codon:yes stop_codon:yes gene_type:complete